MRAAHNPAQSFGTAALVQNTLRSSHRMKRITALEKEEASSPSYFQWREQTIRMPAVSPAPRQAQPGSLIRLLRRIARKS
jgi:hypothetical protein